MSEIHFWTPALAKVSYEFGSVCPSVRLYVNPFTSPFATQERPVNCFISCLFISINVIIIVIIFFLHVVIHKVRKVRKFDLFEKSWRVRRALKDIPIGPRPSSGVDLKKLPVTVDQHVSIYLFI